MVGSDEHDRNKNEKEGDRAEIEGNAAVGVCHGKRSASVADLDAASVAKG